MEPHLETSVSSPLRARFGGGGGNKGGGGAVRLRELYCDNSTEQFPSSTTER